jgi:hypothetical protein
MPAKKRKLDEAPPAEIPEAGAGVSAGRGREGDDASTPRRRSPFAGEIAARSRSSATERTAAGNTEVAVGVGSADDPAAP